MEENEISKPLRLDIVGRKKVEVRGNVKVGYGH
jgi:hypothetical protein